MARAGSSSAAASAAGDVGAFHEVKFRTRVHIPPMHLANPGRAVESILNSMLLKHLDELGGVLVSFSGARLVSPRGQKGQRSVRIVDEQPNAQGLVEVDGVMFAPAVGQRLFGIVNQVGPQHVGLLVAGIFNATIGEESLSGQLSFSPGPGVWAATDGSHTRVAEGSAVEVEVTKIRKSDRDVLTMETSLRRVLEAGEVAKLGLLAASDAMFGSDMGTDWAGSNGLGSGGLGPVRMEPESDEEGEDDEQEAQEEEEEEEEEEQKAAEEEGGEAVEEQPQLKKKRARSASVTVGGDAGTAAEAPAKKKKGKKRSRSKAVAAAGGEAEAVAATPSSKRQKADPKERKAGKSGKKKKKRKADKE